MVACQRVAPVSSCAPLYSVLFGGSAITHRLMFVCTLRPVMLLL